jgi:hypothetical protein
VRSFFARPARAIPRLQRWVLVVHIGILNQPSGASNFRNLKELFMPDRSGSIENLNRMAPAEIQQLAFGVRYEPQLKLIDKIGEVFDEILRADGTPFGPETFPLTDANPLQHRLVNTETDSWLLINSQDTILQLLVKTRNESKVDEWARDFQEYVLRPLRKIGGIKNISRYGVLLHFKEEKATSLKNPPVKRYFSPEFPNVNSLAMRFSRRLPVEEALGKKRVDDFRNAIYSVEQSESGQVLVSIDYQEYFQPMLDAGEWDDRPFPAFVDRGTDYVGGEFQRWFEKFAVVAEVA